MELVNNGKLKRNLLFCLLSAIENDLRANILKLEAEGLVINADIKDKIALRFESENKTRSDEISDLIEYVDFGDYIKIFSSNIHMFSDKKIIEKLNNNLEIILPVRNRVMHIRPLEFDDDKSVYDFTDNLDRFSKVINFSNTKNELKEIKDNPNHIVSIKFDTIKRFKNQIKNNLPMVDYDDTGFIGRVNDKLELKRKILGAFPVITLLGVGGIGKTSLALSTIYDLMEEEKDNPLFFESIIWITLKTKGMFNGDFKEIQTAITTLDDNIKVVGKNFADSKFINIDGIIDYMKKNRTLLIIDNFETINNEYDKDFFDNIPIGSKVLITSRKGVGNYENISKLGELTEKEAFLYLKKLSNIYKVNSLLKHSEIDLKQYLKNLNYSPLAIKWFVINVGKGMSPEQIFNKKYDDYTNFCLSNIYEKLSSNAKLILKLIIKKRNRCNIAEIIYISEFKYVIATESIIELINSNFVIQNEDFSYSIPEFAINYLQSKEDFSIPEQDKLLEKNINKLAGNLENLNGDIHLTNEFHPLSIFPITESDRIATLYVLKAINYSKKNEYDLMNEHLDLAKETSPKFSDIYKIAGFLYSKVNINNSEKNYEIAIDFAISKIPVLYSYSGMLINNQRYEEAEKQLRLALEFDADNDLIKLRLVGLYKKQNKFIESQKLLSEMSIDSDYFTDDEFIKSKYLMEVLDVKIRYADSLINYNNQEAFTLITEAYKSLDNMELIGNAFNYYNYIFSLAHTYIKILAVTNNKMNNFLEFMVKYYGYIYVVKKGHKKEKRFDYDLELLKERISKIDLNKLESIMTYEGEIKGKSEGTISKINDKGYGFIVPFGYTYQTIFFHCSSFKGYFRELEKGDKVSFEINISDSMIKAINVEKIENTYDAEATALVSL